MLREGSQPRESTEAGAVPGARVAVKRARVQHVCFHPTPVKISWH